MATASLRSGPDANGHFGAFGGRYVAETLMPLILDLETAYRAAQADPAFTAQFDDLMKHYVGRPSPLYYAPRFTEELGGAKIYFKRDELNHTGAHKINNCIGQILLAIRMGKTRIIAETGAGQHGVATATVAARFGLPCVIYMGARDIARQAPNVFRMKLLGAEVRAVESGSKTLKDAMNDALRDWVANVHDTFYIIGTAAGPHPYPELVRDFQSVIGKEARAQILEAEGRLPDLLCAAIGGGSNAIGLFHPFLDDESVRIIGIEAAGHGLEAGMEIGRHRLDPAHGNRFRQQGIDAHEPVVLAARSGAVKMRDHAGAMHAGIGTAGTMHNDLVISHTRDGRFQGFLHAGHTGLLCLPAAKGTPVKLNPERPACGRVSN